MINQSAPIARKAGIKNSNSKMIKLHTITELGSSFTFHFCLWLKLVQLLSFVKADPLVTKRRRRFQQTFRTRNALILMLCTPSKLLWSLSAAELLINLLSQRFPPSGTLLVGVLLPSSSSQQCPSRAIRDAPITDTQQRRPAGLSSALTLTES